MLRIIVYEMFEPIEMLKGPKQSQMFFSFKMLEPKAIEDQIDVDHLNQEKSVASRFLCVCVC